MELVDASLVGRNFSWYRPNGLAKSRTDRVFCGGVEEFVSKASKQDCYHYDGGSNVLVSNVIVLGFWRIKLINGRQWRVNEKSTGANNSVVLYFVL